MRVQRASSGSFRKFGTYVAASEGTPIEAGGFFSYKEKAGLMEIGGPVSVGVLKLVERPLEFSELERHVATPEMLVALEGDVVFPLAPANAPHSAPEAGAIEAFRLNQGEAVIMEAGVWHGLPFPLHGQAVLLVVFKEGTPDHDFDLQSAQGQRFEVERV